MGFSIYNLFKAGLLVCNGAAILHPKRFLVKHGLAGDAMAEAQDPIKTQVAGLLQAVSYLKGESAHGMKWHLSSESVAISSLTFAPASFPQCP
jgi:hypothetical protein